VYVRSVPVLAGTTMMTTMARYVKSVVSIPMDGGSYPMAMPGIRRIVMTTTAARLAAVRCVVSTSSDWL